MHPNPQANNTVTSKPSKELSPLKKQMADKKLTKQLKRAKRMYPEAEVPVRKKKEKPDWSEVKVLLDGLNITICEFREQMAIYQNLNLLSDSVKAKIESYRNTFLQDLSSYIDRYNWLTTELKVGPVEEDDLPSFYNIGIKVDEIRNDIVRTLVPLSVQLQADLAQVD